MDGEALDLPQVTRHTLEAFLGVNQELTEQIHQLEAAIEQAAMDREAT